MHRAVMENKGPVMPNTDFQACSFVQISRFRPVNRRSCFRETKTEKEKEAYAMKVQGNDPRWVFLRFRFTGELHITEKTKSNN